MGYFGCNLNFLTSTRKTSGSDPPRRTASEQAHAAAPPFQTASACADLRFEKTGDQKQTYPNESRLTARRRYPAPAVRFLSKHTARSFHCVPLSSGKRFAGLPDGRSGGMRSFQSGREYLLRRARRPKTETTEDGNPSSAVLLFASRLISVCFALGFRLAHACFPLSGPLSLRSDQGSAPLSGSDSCGTGTRRSERGCRRRRGRTARPWCRW